MDSTQPPQNERVAVLGYSSVRDPGRIGKPDLSRQEAIIQRFCQHRGWELVALLRDVELRRTKKMWSRPSLVYAVERIGRGEANCLMATELSRLCPSVAELGWILEAIDQVDGRLISLDPALDTGNPIGRVVARVLLSVSAWERARRAEMTSAARSKMAIPGTISSDLRRRITRLRRAGLTLQAIADMLNDEGVPTVRGGARWRPSSVQAALGYKRPAPWAISERTRTSTRVGRTLAEEPM